MGKGRRKQHRGREAEGRGDADVVFWWEPGGSRWIRRPLPLPPVRFPGGFVRGSLPGVGGRRALRAAGGAYGPPCSPLPAPAHRGCLARTSLQLPGSRSLPAAPATPSGDTDTCSRPQAGKPGGRAGGRGDTAFRQGHPAPSSPSARQPARSRARAPARNPGTDRAGERVWRETGFCRMGRFWSREEEARLRG